MSEHPLQVVDLCAGYGSSQVLFDVSMAAPGTGAIGILGRNGAGKTTLLNTVLGVMPAWSGTVHLAGEDVTALATDALVRRGVGYVPQEQSVFSGLTVRENLLVGTMASRGAADTDIDRVLSIFPKLGDRLRQPAGTLSGGERKMVAISRALLGNPDVLVLDEPTEGVWVGVVEEIGERLADFARAHTVVVVEQHLDFALRLADRAYVMERGRVVLEGPADAIRDDPSLFRFLAP